MNKLNFGDIVLLKFPFTNTKTFKKRPALIIKDLNDNDIIVCRITSKNNVKPTSRFNREKQIKYIHR